ESAAAPNVYPLVPCDCTEPISIGCLAKDFFPTPISITWVSEVDGDNETFPIQLIGSSYSVSSQLTISSSVKGETFQCQVDHSITQSSTTETFVGGLVPPPPLRNPIEKLLVPPLALEDLYLKQNSTITCVVLNLKSTEDVAFSWSRDKGSPLDVTTGEVEKLPNGLNGLSSSLKICAEEWNSGRRSPAASTSRNTTAKAPSVYVLPPPADELVLQETATLTCLATGFSPKDILVTWTQQDRPVSSESFSTFGPKAEGDAFTVYSMLKVPVDEWQRGDTFSCVVGHDGIPLTFIQKNLDKTLGKPTMVNVSVVLSDSEVTCY
uniref:Ig-like domain-containing protein n=1 Tax=Strigops habroptila TaxID=2489341 RepID=A0A672UNW5_STRHB